MKKLLISCVFISLCSFGDDYISPEQAYMFNGQNKTVCGTVAQTVSRKGYVYVNYGNMYPNQSFHLFITKPNNYNNLDQLTNKKVCGYGRIEMYRNKPEITNPIRINIME